MRTKPIYRYLAVIGCLPIVTSTAAESPATSATEQSLPAVVRDMLSQAQTALDKGDAAAAAEWFERAAARGEFPEAEIGEVRARLLAGQFRHALSNANVVAAEHADSAIAQALLAYIDDRIGYTTQALERLHAAQRTQPDAVALIAAEAEILIDRRSAAQAIDVLDHWQQQHGLHPDLCRLRARAALMSDDLPGYEQWRTAAPAANSHLVTDWPRTMTRAFPVETSKVATYGNGLVLDQGRHVLTLRRLVPASTAAIWVRNARGELRRARLEKNTQHSRELAVLSLSEPFAASHSLPTDSMAPLLGHGLCFALGFPASRSADAMQPAVTPCVLIDSNASAKTSRINVSLSSGDDGSPVFDASGRLLGLADSAAAEGITSRPTGTTVWHHSATPTTSAPRPSAFPEMYERLSPSVVQIVTAAVP